MKTHLYLILVVFFCASHAASFPAEPLKMAIDPVTSVMNEGLNDTLVIEKVVKELYVCTCKPDTCNPSGDGKIYYQGKWEVKDENKEDEKHLCDERFLMQWDLSELPEGVEILEAKMRLVCAEYNGDQKGQLVYECISEAWSPDDGYNKKPATMAESRVAADWPKKSSYHYVDITGFVKSWYHEKIPNHGLMGFSVDTETNNSAIFCSSKFPKESVRPRLTVVYQRNP